MSRRSALVGNGIQTRCDIVRRQGNAAVHETTPIRTHYASAPSQIGLRAQLLKAAGIEA